MNVKDYQFTDAERIRYGRFPVLDTIIYRWARRIEETLFDQLGVELYAGASVAEEMRFSNFFASLKRPRPIYTFSMDQLPGTGLLVLDNRFAHLCLNDGRINTQGPLSLSPENQRRLQQVVQALVSDFDASWADVLPVQTHLKKITTYLFRARILNAYEPCMVAQIHLSGAEASARLIWCFPRMMLDPCLDKLSKSHLVPTLYQDRAVHEAGDPEQLVGESRYRLGVTLGSVNLTHGGKPFGVGSVLPIQSKTGGQPIVSVNGVPVFLGELGEVDGSMAIKIAGPYEEQAPTRPKNPGSFSSVSWPTVKG